MIEQGKTHVVQYPFYRGKKVVAIDGPGPYAEIDECWIPGCEAVQEGYDWSWVADRMGEMILTVISTHKPGPKYPTRVFYTRQWRDPDGKVFGRGKLRITTQPAFNRLLRGYRHDYELTDTEWGDDDL